MFGFLKRTKRPQANLPEAELARRMTAPGYRCTCCGNVVDAAHAVRVRPFGWTQPPAPLPDSAFDEVGGDLITECYARRGRDLLVRANLPIPVRGTDDHVFLGVWANLSTGDFARFRSAQGRGEADRMGDLFAWLYCRIPATTGPVLTKGVIVPVAGGATPVYWITDEKHPLFPAQQDGGMSAHDIAALFDDLGAGEVVTHLRS